MTELVVRRLLIDMQAPIARHWCGGDAFRTALFNALSMSFPVGEQFFIDAFNVFLVTLTAFVGLTTSLFSRSWKVLREILLPLSSKAWQALRRRLTITCSIRWAFPRTCGRWGA